MGKSGCGKSTLERNLIKQAPDTFKKVVSTTTRPKRDKEVDGEDYYFVSPGMFDNMDMIQTTHFAGKRYGSSLSEYTTPHECPILVVVPDSAKTFTSVVNKRFPDWNIFYIYFNISDERLKQNMRSRGDTDEMIDARLAQDTLDKDYENSGIVADYTVFDEDLTDKLAQEVRSEIFFTKLEPKSSRYRGLTGIHPVDPNI